MPLTAADLTRIYKYKAFTLGSQAGGALTTADVLTLIQQQIDNINATDTALGTTFAANIQADLATLDRLDSDRTSGAADGGIKILGIEDGIEYFPGGAQRGFTQEMEILRRRVARVLSQSYSDSDDAAITMSYRG